LEQKILNKGLVDLVTETDKKVEEFIIKHVQERFPGHKFLAEESFDGNYNYTDEPTWIM